MHHPHPSHTLHTPSLHHTLITPHPHPSPRPSPSRIVPTFATILRFSLLSSLFFPLPPFTFLSIILIIAPFNTARLHYCRSSTPLSLSFSPSFHPSHCISIIPNFHLALVLIHFILVPSNSKIPIEMSLQNLTAKQIWDYKWDADRNAGYPQLLFAPFRLTTPTASLSSYIIIPSLPIIFLFFSYYHP